MARSKLKRKISKQDKPGKVLRLDEDTWSYVQKLKTGKERWSDLIRKAIGLSPKGEELKTPEEKFTLPSMLFDSSAEAKGQAIYKSVKEKTKPEKPVPVKKLPL